VSPSQHYAAAENLLNQVESGGAIGEPLAPVRLMAAQVHVLLALVDALTEPCEVPPEFIARAKELGNLLPGAGEAS
jgi:hypothetical protein